MHSKALKHFSRSAETNHLAFMLHGESRQKNGDESILPNGNMKLRMTCDLKNKAAIAAFISQLFITESANGQAA